MNSLTASLGSAFQLKGTLFTLTVLQLLTTDMAAFSKQLEAAVVQTPNFFKNAPIVLDLSRLMDENTPVDFARLRVVLRTLGMVPVGVRNASAFQQGAATQAGLGILSSDRADPLQQEYKNSTPKCNQSKVVTHPVRSGQQVYAQNADLVVTASVSPGAEILADGHIHVYGTLRGRALAGIGGNADARIFCSQLDAELVSIAGHYKLNEDISLPEPATKSVQIFLDEGKLLFQTI